MRGAQRSCSTFEQQMKCLPTSCIHALLKRRLKPLNSLQICVQLWNCNIYASPPFCVMNSLHRYLKDVLVKYVWFIRNDYAKLDEVDHFCLPNEEKSLKNRIIFVLFFRCQCSVSGSRVRKWKGMRCSVIAAQMHPTKQRCRFTTGAIWPVMKLFTEILPVVCLCKRSSCEYFLIHSTRFSTRVLATASSNALNVARPSNTNTI